MFFDYKVIWEYGPHSLSIKEPFRHKVSVLSNKTSLFVLKMHEMRSIVFKEISAG